MKSVAGLVVLFIFHFPALFAQEIKTDTIKLQDTVKIEIVGRRLSKELVQLRDSINNTIETIGKNENKAGVHTKDKLQKATLNLGLYKDRLNNDIQEVFVQTSRNGWSKPLIDRVKRSSGDVRREYKRILKEIKNDLVVRS